MTDRLLTPAQASEILGFSVSALNQWRMAGKGPEYVKIGRAVRYTESALREFVEARTKGTPTREGLRNA